MQIIGGIHAKLPSKKVYHSIEAETQVIKKKIQTFFALDDSLFISAFVTLTALL